MVTPRNKRECLRLDQIPGLDEILVEAKQEQFKTREDGWLELTHDVLGFRIRTMTVRDYVLLERCKSPFLYRQEPKISELALFLWILSEAFQPGKSQRIRAFIHGQKVRRAFGRDIPKSSETAVVECFKYIDKMFFDSPASVGNGGESCLSYLTGWFDLLQSEYHCGEEEIWNMGLPKLFQRLKAISHRNNPHQPNFNRKTDGLKKMILDGLRDGRFTMQGLRDGIYKDEFRSNLN